MSLNFAEIPKSGGGFFKPEDHQDAVALLVEVIDFEAQRPGGNFGPKDSALCNITVFNTAEELDSGEPTHFLEGTRVEGKATAADLKGLVGQATIATIVQVPPTKVGYKPAWVWRSASADTRNKVIAYANDRETQAADALAAVPGFD